MSINGVTTNISGSIMSQGMRSRPDPAEQFQKLDADSSGTLDKTELSELAKQLSKMSGKSLDIDASITTYDGDGGLSQDEKDTMMRQTMGPPPSGPPGGPDSAEMFSALDSDGSGGISESELAAMTDNLSELTGESSETSGIISTYDTDGDGQLSRDELQAMLEDNGPPPPPLERIGGASAQQISNAYLANSGEDTMSRLQQILSEMTANLSGESDSSS